MSEPQWHRYPRVGREPHARVWLTIQANLGRAATVDAHGRALEDYFGFGERRGIVPACFTREHIATYVNDLALLPNRRATAADGVAVGQSLANATLQQRLTAIRLYHGYLVEEGLRPDNPVGRDRHCAVEPHHRAAGEAQQLLVPLHDLRPVRLGGAPGVRVRGGDRGLWLLDEALRRVFDDQGRLESADLPVSSQSGV